MSQKKLIEERLALVARKHEMNWFITIPFTHRIVDKRRYRANKSDVNGFAGLIAAYANELSVRAFGRTHQKRLPEESVPFVAIAEHRTREGANCFPHFHAAVKFPKGTAEELLIFSFEYWRRKGKAVCGKPVILHFESVFNVDGCLKYSSKWLDDNDPLDIIAHGVDLSL